MSVCRQWLCYVENRPVCLIYVENRPVCHSFYSVSLFPACLGVIIKGLRPETGNHALVFVVFFKEPTDITIYKSNGGGDCMISPLEIVDNYGHLNLKYFRTKWFKWAWLYGSLSRVYYAPRFHYELLMGRPGESCVIRGAALWLVESGMQARANSRKRSVKWLCSLWGTYGGIHASKGH